MRLRTQDRGARLRDRGWHLKFAWLPVFFQGGKFDGTLIWLEPYLRLRIYVPQSGGARWQWDRRLPEASPDG